MARFITLLLLISVANASFLKFLAISVLSIPVKKILKGAGLLGLKFIIGANLLHFFSRLNSGRDLLDLLGTNDSKIFDLPEYSSSNYFQFKGYDLNESNIEHLFTEEFLERANIELKNELNSRNIRVEQIFNMLSKVDDKSCISRLVCEIGGRPSLLDGFGENIRTFFSLMTNLTEGSTAHRFNLAHEYGQENGFPACQKAYSMCDQRTFSLLKKAFPKPNLSFSVHSNTSGFLNSGSKNTNGISSFEENSTEIETMS